MNESTEDAAATEIQHHCDVCGNPIEDKRRTFVLCNLEAHPETPAIHVARECCLEPYEQRFGRAWMLFSLDSPGAGVLLRYAARRSSDPASRGPDTSSRQ